MATTISGDTGVAANSVKFLIGQVVFIAGTTAPSGFLKCDGSAISRTTYASLFAVCGTTFGVGDGSTTFNLPDLRGEFIRALDDGRGVDTSRTLGSYQADAFKTHTHQVDTMQDAGYDTAYDGGSVHNTPTDQLHVLTTTTATGGTETRPRNVALLAVVFTGI